MRAPSSSSCLFATTRRAFRSPLAVGASYEKAKELLRLSWEFEQNARADKELVSGTISVGCFESVAPLYMPKLVPDLKRCIRNNLQLYDGEQHELMHGLHRGRFDLALVYDLELGHSISKETLNAPHNPYALLPASHPLAQKKSVTLQEIKPGADDFARCGAQ
ncbi:DNA-binding transcriptional regulator OxyR [Raoultella terrigena]|uniref:DNA-binding transcriptional regulator OxyR n=1 Tax=Raoultella terrigena TaxID=577 RepID=A0A4U9CWV5_RAOTE|nr:DNA-binding transcriptional regulator OxyR [Raoultella terrigena]